MSNELSVISSCYDLVIWTAQHVEKFPRSHQFGLGARLREKLLDMFDLLLEAKRSAHKQIPLEQTLLLIEQVRYLFRMVKDLKLLAIKSHQFAAQQIDDIGRQVGGWYKHAKATP